MYQLIWLIQKMLLTYRTYSLGETRVELTFLRFIIALADYFDKCFIEPFAE